METPINDIIKGIDRLTPMPAVTGKLMEVAGDPGSSLADLADILRYDADLTANLLKMCNSTFFGLRVTVDSVHQAVSLLGMDRILEMVLLAGIIAEKWNFSPEMVFMISNHHLSDEEAKGDLETAIVYLADTVSRMAGIGIGADGLAYKVYDDIFDSLGVSEINVQGIMAEFQASLNKAERLLHAL